MRRNMLMALAVVPLLAACGGGGGKVASASVKAPPKATSAASAAAPRPPMRYRPRNPVVQNLPGVEGVIGANAAGLTRQFGQPRLDVWEGDARKLQFSGEACVLDIYLYPLRPGAEPTATYVEARRASDGLDVDKVACAKALHR
ncbi:MAG: hypothetical protein WCY11_20710 [Novosphingobium sp.]